MYGDELPTAERCKVIEMGAYKIGWLFGCTALVLPGAGCRMRGDSW